MEEYLQVGVITSVHGVRGEVKVFPTTDDPSRFEELETVIFDDGKQQKTLEIENVKYFKNQVILKFKGIDDRNTVEAFRQAKLLITRDQAVPLEEGEYFIADLIDLDVVSTEGENLGVLTEVMETGANDVFVVKNSEGKELLLPNIPDCIREVDFDKNQMTVYLMPGLRD